MVCLVFGGFVQGWEVNWDVVTEANEAEMGQEWCDVLPRGLCCIVTNAVMPGGVACWESMKSPHPPPPRDSCESQGTLVSFPFPVESELF